MIGNQRDAARAAAGRCTRDVLKRHRLGPAALLACLAWLAWLACLGMLACLTPVAARAAAGAPRATDAVVDEVVQMLRGGVTEPVILAWLDKTGKRPAAIDSADLVALHQAGASENLLKRLVELAGTTAPAAPPPPEAPRAAPTPPPAPPAPAAAPAPPVPAAAPAPAPPAAASAPHPEPATAGGASVKVRFAVTYRPVEIVDEEAPINQRWLLVLYVDGRFVAAVPPGPVLVPLSAKNFERELAPGKHWLRVAQERHLRYSSARGYISSSRVEPEAIPFEVKAGAAAVVNVHFGEKSFRHPGPVAVRVQEDGKQVAEVEPASPNSEAWPALCEDVPASLPAGAKLPRAAQHDLQGCVHWATLWPGIADVPARGEVLGEIDRSLHPQG